MPEDPTSNSNRQSSPPNTTRLASTGAFSRLSSSPKSRPRPSFSSATSYDSGGSGSHSLQPSQAPVPIRTQSLNFGAPLNPSRSFSLPSSTHQQQFQSPPSPSAGGPGEEAMDEMDMSIAAQAEVIRKERLEKRLEKEKQREEAAAAAAATATAQPMLKRRSTRAGSTSVEGMGNAVLVGNLIGQDHRNYVLMYNMLTGIRIGVSRCQAKLKRPLTDADYTARHKFSFDIVGNELTPSVKYDFKFKDYAPWVFRELREFFYLDPSDYLVSLTAKYILSELGSPGKSGSFFYFSRDYRFIIKTIRHSEHKFLRSILKEYYEYIKSNPHTLISRFYGLHRVKLPRGKKIHFVIMNNLFPPHRDIHERYDLKGSAIGRITPEEKAKANPNSILKDLNWVGRGRQFDLGPEKKALFEEQLRRDTELMQRLGIMDYSLLTGIHNVQRGNVDNLRDGMLTVFQPEAPKVRRRQPTQVKRDADASALRQAIQRSDPKALSESNKLPDVDTSESRRFLFYQDEGGIRATGDNNEDLQVIYYLGIIDILTPYGILKKLEHFFRGLKHDKHMISAVPPQEYGDRFMSFIKSVIRGNDPSKRPRMYEHDPPPLASTSGSEVPATKEKPE
ncbi:SAICAR synthase-like protein [Meredithblackwellia eburnea MCA 4105]